MYKDKVKMKKNALKWKNEHPERHKEITNNASNAWKVRNRARVLLTQRARNRKRKYAVLSAYSKNGIPECFCCGEKELDFLCIDHPDNNGKQHRKDLQVFGSGAGFYLYLVRNNFPKTVKLQTSCYNCNNSRKISGQCIHKKIK